MVAGTSSQIVQGQLDFEGSDSRTGTDFASSEPHTPLLGAPDSSSGGTRKRRRKRVTSADKVQMRAIEPGLWIGEYVALRGPATACGRVVGAVLTLSCPGWLALLGSCVVDAA